MTDDFTHALLFEQWEDEGFERGCILGGKCLHHDPEHTSDECFDEEYITEYYNEMNRDTEEYKQGAKEERERWKAAVESLYEKMKPENRSESMPNDAVAGYYEALEELLAKMEEGDD